MSLLSSIGLSDLQSRRPRERATFFMLVAVSTFLFMDQNLMAPNLSAIGEELVVSRATVRERLLKEDAEYARLDAEASAGDARARELSARLAARRDALVAASPGLKTRPAELEARLAESADGISADELKVLSAAAAAVEARDAKLSAAVQAQVDDRLAGRASLWFWLLGGVMALAVGYVTDKWPRKLLLVGTIFVGAMPCLLTGFARNVDEFVLLRALTGIGIGAVLPLTYSLLGDLFSARGRPAAAAWVGLATGIGIAGGQLLAGIMGPVQGWRLPFIIVAVPNLILAVALLLFAEEPKRGSAEAALSEAMEAGAEYNEKIRLSDLKKLFANKTNLLVFAQGIPGSMPWGFFFTFLVDYYHSNKGFSVQAATLLVTVFGAGAILGGFVGGLVGGKLYRRNPALLPTLCAIAIFLGIAPILAIVNWSSAGEAPLQQALHLFSGSEAPSPSILWPALLGVVGAFLATVTSSNVKAVLIDVNPPENRGTIFSLFNLADDLGKGLAPFLIAKMALSLGRTTSYNVTILMWLICGVVWLALIKVFPKDVARLEHELERRASGMKQGVPAVAPAPSVAV